uniref:Putative secreted protein n=1 Tax=Haematobia irritans TaxID=7368 RepID=A0A1L8EIS6_HAEIR
MTTKIADVLFFVLCIGLSWASDINADSENEISGPSSDMQTSATSAKLLNLGGLLGGGSYYPNNNRPNYYPNSGGYYPNSGGYYPNSGGFYPSTGSYPTNGYYPTNYPSNGYYPSSAYPNSGYPYSTTYGNAGYYPSSTYYPTSGTNMLGGTGNGGYGGYGGNGGLHQYYGYWNPNYVGRRNLGYGYYKNTDRYGLPKLIKEHRYNSARQETEGMTSRSCRGYD